MLLLLYWQFGSLTLLDVRTFSDTAVIVSAQFLLVYDGCAVTTRTSFFESDLPVSELGLPCFDSDLPCLESDLPIFSGQSFPLFEVSPSHFQSQTRPFVRVSPSHISKSVLASHFSTQTFPFFRSVESVLLIFRVRFLDFLDLIFRFPFHFPKSVLLIF